MDRGGYIGKERRSAEIQRMETIVRLAAGFEELSNHSEKQQELLEKMSGSLVDFKLEIQKELSGIRSDIEKGALSHTSFMEIYTNRTDNCQKIQDDHEKRIRDLFNLPRPECIQVSRIDNLEKENKNQDKVIFKIMGASAVICSSGTLLLQWLLKKI